MKHLMRLSTQKPCQAGAFGDIVCEANEALRDFLQFTGGAKPGKEFASDRCDLPGEGGPTG